MGVARRTERAPRPNHSETNRDPAERLGAHEARHLARARAALARARTACAATAAEGEGVPDVVVPALAWPTAATRSLVVMERCAGARFTDEV